MQTYVIDIDGTICTNTYGEYKKAKPFYDRIAFINKAISKYKWILERNSNYIEARGNFALALKVSGSYEAAIVEYERTFRVIKTSVIEFHMAATLLLPAQKSLQTVAGQGWRIATRVGASQIPGAGNGRFAEEAGGVPFLKRH